MKAKSKMLKRHHDYDLFEVLCYTFVLQSQRVQWSGPHYAWLCAHRPERNYEFYRIVNFIMAAKNNISYNLQAWSIYSDVKRTRNIIVCMTSVCLRSSMAPCGRGNYDQKIPAVSNSMLSGRLERSQVRSAARSCN